MNVILEQNDYPQTDLRTEILKVKIKDKNLINAGYIREIWRSDQLFIQKNKQYLLVSNHILVKKFKTRNLQKGEFIINKNVKEYDKVGTDGVFAKEYWMDFVSVWN